MTRREGRKNYFPQHNRNNYRATFLQGSLNNGLVSKSVQILYSFIKNFTDVNTPSAKLVKSVRIRSYSGPYSVQMRENTDQNNSEYGHLLRSVSQSRSNAELTMRVE